MFSELPRSRLFQLTALGAVLSLAIPCASAQLTTRVSLDSTGAQAIGSSNDARVSEDGRFVVFSTDAALVPADTNGISDVYRHDRNTGVVDLVSMDTSGAPGNGASRHPAVTNNGQVVAFETVATNFADLGVPDTNGVSDICVRQYGTSPGVHYVTLDYTPLASGSPAILANGASRFPDIAAEPIDNGFFDVYTVVFESDASNLAYDQVGSSIDTNGLTDVYLSRSGSIGWNGPATVLPAHEMVSWDTFSGPTIIPGNGPSGGQGILSCAISREADFVAFSTSATNLLSGVSDTNGVADILLYDVSATQSVGRVSVDSSGNQAIGGPSTYPAISADGGRVAFQSTATNLVAGGSSTQHVYAHDVASGHTIRASQSTAGAAGGGVSQRPDISADGAFIGFDSVATNLVANDTNGVDDVFVHSFLIRSTLRASLSDQNVQGNLSSTDVCLTETGGEMVFSSLASNLIGGDTNAASDVFYRGCDPLGSVYCTSQTNSQGCTPWIGFNGSSSSSLNTGFQVTTRNLINQTIGQYIYGVGTSASAFPYQGGFICVGTPLWRGPGLATGGSPTGIDCTGIADFDFNSITSGTNPVTGMPFVPGTTIRTQFWSRDNTAPLGTNLSDAVFFTICH